jgi:hypothetical protein
MGTDLRMRSEKSAAWSAACAASLMRERWRRSAKGHDVSTCEQDPAEKADRPEQAAKKLHQPSW